MNNILLYSDLHITQNSLQECIGILEEIGMIANKYNCDTLISLGDNFDSIRPSSKELDIFATFIKRLGNKQHIILAAQSHESETTEQSVLNHYGILSDNITIVKEFKDENYLYAGHFYLKESPKNFGATVSQKDLKDYKFVFLGHYHSFYKIKPNICGLGSTRYVDFSEAQDSEKVVAVILNYKQEKEEKVLFIPLKSPYKMKEFILNSNKFNELEEKSQKNIHLEALQSNIIAKNDKVNKDTKPTKSSISTPQKPLNLSQIDLLCQNLDKLDPNTKVKVKIQDFKSFKAFLPLEAKYKEKFIQFIRVNDFDLIPNSQIDSAKKDINLKEAFLEFAKEKQLDDSIKNLLLEELK